jgi:hypothetical protein
LSQKVIIEKVMPHGYYLELLRQNLFEIFLESSDRILVGNATSGPNRVIFEIVQKAPGFEFTQKLEEKIAEVETSKNVNFNKFNPNPVFVPENITLDELGYL